MKSSVYEPGLPHVPDNQLTFINLLVTSNTLFDELFKDFAPGYFVKPLHGDAMPAQIKLDLKERDTAYTVNADIPGVSKDEIHVGIDGNLVTLHAEVKQLDKKAEGEKVLRTERYFGALTRSFQLPVDIEAGQAKAKYENGVLTLTLPKKLGQNSKRLTVE